MCSQQKQREQNSNSSVNTKKFHKVDDEIDLNMISTAQIEDEWDRFWKIQFRIHRI